MYGKGSWNKTQPCFDETIGNYTKECLEVLKGLASQKPCNYCWFSQIVFLHKSCEWLNQFFKRSSSIMHASLSLEGHSHLHNKQPGNFISLCYESALLKLTNATFT